MNELFETALQYATRDWSVFPLHGIVNECCTCGRSDCPSPGKHPLTRHGVLDASTDEAAIRKWWRRWPRANVAIATGEKSGIVVIDLDLPKAFVSLDLVIHKLPSTLISLTGGGGLHLIYRRAADASLRKLTSRSDERGEQAHMPLRNHTSGLPGIPGALPGIDLRAEGGHIVAPPSLHISGNHYAWLDPATPIAEAPEWLRERPRRIIPIAPAAVAFEGDGTEKGLRVLRQQLDILRRAKQGQRNHTLNRCAFVVARYVASGHLLESAARAELSRVALSIGLTRWESENTIASAFGAGVGRLEGAER